MSKKPSSPDRSFPLIEALEWTFAALSALVVLALFGFLAIEAIGKTGGQPDIELRLVQVREFGGQYFAEVAVQNYGKVAAASVEIEGSAGPGEQSETPSATLDYAPPQSTERVTLGFAHPVHAEDIQLLVTGFREP